MGDADLPPDPRHIAFIMDGNGRWAEARGKSRNHGHKAGADAVRRVVELAVKREIPYITLYAFSTENWSRPRSEVSALMRLLGVFITAELPGLRKNGIRLRVLGDMSRLSGGLRKKLSMAEEATAGNGKVTLSLAVNYGGRDEIVRAARSLMRDAANGGILPETIDEAAFAARLDTAGIPDPDLVIRTAGEWRLSNFLVWQAAYAELYVTPRCWPDFCESDLDDAIAEYRGRTRKFGALAPSR